MKFKELEGKGLEWKYLTERGEKDVAVVNLVMNYRLPQKFRTFLHQLKNKAIYRYDLLFTDFVSQFVWYVQLSATFLRPLSHWSQPNILATLRPKLDLNPVATSQTDRCAMSAAQHTLQ